MKVTVDIPDDVIDSLAGLIKRDFTILTDASDAVRSHAAFGVKQKSNTATITIPVDAMTVIGALFTMGKAAFCEALEQRLEES